MEEIENRFSSKALEDFQLIDRAVGGDDKAFAKLLQRYKRPVYHMILKMVRNVDDAEDLMIESFAKAFKSLHRFKKDFTFSTWLFVLPVIFTPGGVAWYLWTGFLLREIVLVVVVHKGSRSVGDSFEAWKTPFLDFNYAIYYLGTGLVALVSKRVRWKK